MSPCDKYRDLGCCDKYRPFFESLYLSQGREKTSIFYIGLFPIFQCKSDIGLKQLPYIAYRAKKLPYIAYRGQKINLQRTIGGFVSYIGFKENVVAISAECAVVGPGLKFAFFC